MSTRVTSAIASRKARENLIRLLFPKDHSASTGRVTAPVVSFTHETDRHSHSSRRRIRQQGNANKSPFSNDAYSPGHQKRHSYSQLRSVYLEKVHDMHPDKMAHDKTTSKKDGAHLQFIELKNAWEEYHTSMRIVQRRRGDNERSNSKSSNGTINNNKQAHSEDNDIWEEDDEHDNFTMFGVGCSFADSPEERDLRNEIMEQACRGWFSSGSISYAERIASVDDSNNQPEGLLDDDKSAVLRGTDDSVHRSKETMVQRPQVKLSDDDMFVCDGDQRPTKEEDASKKRFLVQNVDRTRRKR